jgi:transcription elongation factor GreA
MADKPIYLTLEGKKKLEEELQYLVNVRRKEVAAAIQSAKEEGDIAKILPTMKPSSPRLFSKGVSKLLKRSFAKQSSFEMANDLFDVGSKVTVVEEGFDKKPTIVGSAEADPLNSKISNDRRLAKPAGS